MGKEEGLHIRETVEGKLDNLNGEPQRPDLLLECTVP
jgi:hypothetical protein